MTFVVIFLGAAGLTMFVASLPIARRRSIGERIEPYLGGLHGRPSPLLSTAQRSLMSSRLQLLWERYRPGSTDRLLKRLTAAGSQMSPGQFRLEQVTWGITAFVGVIVAIGLATTAGIPPAPTAAAVLGLLAFVTAVLARDWLLGRRTIERTARLVQELPTAIDLLTLSILAGESIPAAFARVAAHMPGGIGDELRRVVADVRAGDPLVVALETFKRRIPDPAVFRLIDALIIGIEKGAPLSDVLRSQATDLREGRRRYLLELGGRREILMLVPVVFLIMPVVIVFALWPGLVTLDLLVP